VHTSHARRAPYAMAPPQPLVPAFAALAVLQRGPSGTARRAAAAAVEDLSSTEAELLREFEAAGRRCLSQLGGGALAALQEAREEGAGSDGEQDGGDAQAAEADDAGTSGPVGKESVRKMFEYFDTNGDGRLGREQFQEVLMSLGLGEQFSGTELAALIDAADTNRDGSVDLQEFTTWLYGAEDMSGMAGQAGANGGDSEEDVRMDERAQREQNQRRQLCRMRTALEEAEAQVLQVQKASELALKQAEERFEHELDTSLQFWRAAAKSSAGPALASSVDLNDVQLLGNGKYGYVLKAQRLSDGKPVVVKLLSLRWAHVAAKEWGQAQVASDHPHIVEYAEVMLHADEDKALAELLQAAQREGKLHSRVKRGFFPEHYVCLMQEFMNRGTVQDWMDRDLLMPGGLLEVMRCVASALAYMHQRGLTHNDVKPENVLLSQEDTSDPRAKVSVKLADLGLAARSTHRSDDFWQYGMTALCMTTGEKFGSRKFQPSSVPTFVADVARCVAECGASPGGTGGGRVLAALATLPDLLSKVWAVQLTMFEVSEWRSLQGWGFFDGEAAESPARVPSTAEAQDSHSLLNRRILQKEQVMGLALLSSRRSSRDLGALLPEGDEE